MSEQEPDPQLTPMELIGPLLPLQEKGRGAKGQVPGLNSNLLVNSESSIDTRFIDDPSDFNSNSAQHIENKTSSSSHNKHLKSSVSINLILVSLCSRQSLRF